MFLRDVLFPMHVVSLPIHFFCSSCIFLLTGKLETACVEFDAVC